MDFKRARTPAQIENRQDEIVRACKKIYMDEGYEGMSIKKISDSTSLTRPALYSYYKTKEEIFLDILKEEFSAWQEDLSDRRARASEYTREEFCSALAGSISERKVMLELIAVYLNTIENNSRLERLVEFKRTAYSCLDCLKEMIEAFFPEQDEESKQEFFDIFTTYLNGIYPHVFHSKIQKEAMEIVGRPHIDRDLGQVCLKDLLLLTSGLK